MRAHPWRGSRFLSHRYPNSGLKFRLLLWVIDAVIGFVTALVRTVTRSPLTDTQRPSNQPAKILLIATGHLGDVVIASSALRDVRILYPHARIGVCVGSWSSAVLQRHPAVEWMHVVDHPRINRRDRTIWGRMKTFIRSLQYAVPQIRAIGYDTMFNLQERHSLLPAALLFRIPRRIGFGIGGFRHLLTDCIAWPGEGLHRAEHHRHVVAVGDVDRIADLPPPRAWLPAAATGTPLPANLPQRYVLIHPGTGDGAKRWPDHNWMDLAGSLQRVGLTLVVCGLGKEDRRTAQALKQTGIQFIDLVDRLSFDQMCLAIQGASCLVSVDSVSAHLAAAFEVPSVSIWSGITSPRLFAPLNLQAVTLRQETRCSPCHRPCEGMECVRRVSPLTVQEQTLTLLTGPRRKARESGAR